MNYNKLVFHEDTWPDVVGRTLTFNCKRYELELKTIEGIRSCSITMAECIAFRSRFDLSHIDTWAEEYHPSFGAMVLDGNSWYLKAVLREKAVQRDARLQWPSSVSSVEHVLSRHYPHVHNCTNSWHSETG